MKYSGARRFLQYLVIAKDHPQSLSKRLNIRPKHLENANKAKEKGLILLGGATLDDSGEMNGSAMIFEADSVNQVENYLSKDPYYLEGVWSHWTITRYRIAGISNKLTTVK